MLTETQSADSAPSAQTITQVVRLAVDHYLGQQGNLLPILHAIQHAIGYVPPEAVPMLTEELQLSRAEIHGVIRFYPHFREQPAGPVILEICRAESCQAMGGTELAEHARRSLGCNFHETSLSGTTTLEPVYCLGLCAQSPAVMINGMPYARMTPARLDQLLQNAEAQS
ncbi:MAG: formate dehydrogenase subunit gamma [Burkholderiaceae bacterium]|nr:formate dehydrogenase subunit gamma [Burkholderiaceae bacterium]